VQKTVQPLMGSKDLHIAEKAFKIMREVEEASYRGHKRISKLLRRLGSEISSVGPSWWPWVCHMLELPDTIETFFSGHVQLAGLRGLRGGQNPLLHMCMGLMGCDQGGGFKDSKGRGETNIMQDGTVDLQHGTGANGDCI
jgi:hypothetical protein